jgi:hypothetical protein
MAKNWRHIERGSVMRDGAPFVVDGVELESYICRGSRWVVVMTDS